MWKKFRDAIHHLFDPHCDLCEEKEMELSHCPSCDILKSLLEQSSAERQRMFQEYVKAVGLQEPQAVGSNELPQMPTPIRTFTPWRVTRHKLEELERKKAQKVREDKDREVAQIEELKTQDISDKIENLESEVLQDATQ